MRLILLLILSCAAGCASAGPTVTGAPTYRTGALCGEYIDLDTGVKNVENVDCGDMPVVIPPGYRAIISPIGEGDIFERRH